MALTVSISNPTSGATIANALQQTIVDFLRPLISVTGSAGGSTDSSTVIGSSVPIPGDQGKIWYRTSGDINGYPLGAYFYFNGKWCRVYTLPVGAVMRWDNSDPTPYFDLTSGYGLFTSTTAGIANDWYGWRMHLNSDTTSHYKDRFIINANRYNTGAEQWETLLPDGSYDDRGGKNGGPLQASDIPSLPVTGKVYDSGAAASGNWEVVMTQQHTGGFVTSAVDESGYVNSATTNISAFPAFIAKPIMTFVGMNYTDPTTGT